MKYIQSTLVIVIKNNEILLGMKKRGLGVGKWNGFGGKLADGETLKHCAVRELQEESGLITKEKDLKKIGILMFDFMGEDFMMEVNVFKTIIFSGIPEESEEMVPKWFCTENVPFYQMWADDVLWYPLMFQNKHFFGMFQFKGHDNMISSNLVTVNNLNEMKILRDKTRNDYNIELKE